MARKKSFDETKVLEAVQDVFWLKGFADTSIADLEKATSLVRTSIYACFGDKEALYQKALHLYQENVKNTLDNILFENLDPIAKLKKLFVLSIDSGINDPDKKGCFIANATAERCNICPTTTHFIHENRKLIIKKFTHLFDQAKAQGNISHEADIVTYANVAFSLYSGLMLSCKSGATKKELLKSVEIGFRSFV